MGVDLSLGKATRTEFRGAHHVKAAMQRKGEVETELEADELRLVLREWTAHAERPSVTAVRRS